MIRAVTDKTDMFVVEGESAEEVLQDILNLCTSHKNSHYFMDVSGPYMDDDDHWTADVFLGRSDF